MIITILSFIIVFGILVFVHEFGHFIVAKKSGIMVREFSIGMGPKIFYYRHNETTYTIRILPLGGYVRMAGAYDDIDELTPGTPVNLQLNEQGEVTLIDASNDSRALKGIPLEVTSVDLVNELYIEGYQSNNEEKQKYVINHDALIAEKDGTKLQIAPKDVQFQNADVWKKILTNSAGIINNVILAIVAFSLLAFLQGGVAKQDNTVNPINNNSIAKKAGITDGDRILSVDNVSTKNWSELSSAVQSKPNKWIHLKVKNKDSIKNIKLKTSQQTINGKKIGAIDVKNSVDKSFIAKITYGFSETWNLTKSLFSQLAYMVTGHFSINDLGGPVAIFADTSQATKLGLVGVIYFIALLSINLAIMNLIPIPALDGGKILLNVIEAFRGKPTSETIETVTTLVGAGIIVILMLLVTINDIQRYFIH